ncbi:large-conductance mechanosensitive channel protein MscL [Lentilactobacillus otakiensis]|uniref:Large-conductance mechanosensitive channel n=1 Tax=Lentilactobacillus otakiensis DSM 19908 = JCM 15040 TaxID=1423780 RepID=S4NNN5_9LACO|nr:large-conductance mechanosensitive channel protein MscL [Lentilactobacillus otakiensis]KRL09355.1 Large-conductance mechanosensitive channel [Lentilactobacillus otakiensis DSM 19908 = JCM 15040]MBZ3776592.1 large-conductance mechanosensitive channel protein MscL [Lentilactobacillus otakiensis]MDV3517505.1 large-conductance mechanosensitive channel protein MscL [Lentilactobacillus otakiensis]GAD15638.1 large-conductance mechanosensitive channel [Lentilactobacillus otakiensis DSM 19908 = JCM 1
MLKEFKEFIARGNVIDLAVGVIIGGAFTGIVTSLTNNLINPLIGIFLGRMDLSNLVIKVGDATFRYGAFINSLINFIIVAFVVFILIKLINKVIKRQPARPAIDNKEVLLSEIRDLLKDKQ